MIDAQDFGRLQERADQILSTLRGHCADDHEWHEKIDARLRKIEESHANAAGRQSAWAVLSAAVVSIIVGFVGHKIS